MLLKELQLTLNDLFVENDLDQIFNILKQLLDFKSKAYLQFLILCKRYNKLQDKVMIDAIEKDYAETRENKLGQDLLKFIQKLNQPDLKLGAVYINKGVPNKILVLTNDEELEDLKVFFHKIYFNNATVKILLDKNYSYDNYDLIIFDNRDLPICYNQKVFESLKEKEKVIIKDRTAKMEKCLKKSSRLIIHFGHILFWVNHHRDRVQAANSKFSLHARTKEVIDFINTYRV